MDIELTDLEVATLIGLVRRESSKRKNNLYKAQRIQSERNPDGYMPKSVYIASQEDAIHTLLKIEDKLDTEQEDQP